MKCPYCEYEESKVIDSRPTDDGEKIRRRRECLRCLKRFTTYEIVENLPIIVIKKDNTREEFDREKILKGLIKACEKRPISLEKLENSVNSIEKSLQNNFEREISTNAIGELVMEKLKDIDKVAYIRFASVYRRFDDVDNFMSELKKLLTEKKS
ncbi:MAG: transcriptional regulator NrdR [Clostridia bacterium]|nr:transcriptional regulator NrdR [Clostridia bacterium]